MSPSSPTPTLKFARCLPENNLPTFGFIRVEYVYVLPSSYPDPTGLENGKPTGQVFIADLHIHKQLNVPIATAGFTAVLHIDSEYDEFEILELIQKIHPKTNEPIKDKPLFVSQGDRVICRIQMFNMTSIEKSYEFQEFKRFTVHIPEGESSAATVEVIELA